MPRGYDSSRSPGRRPVQSAFEIVPGFVTGQSPDRVSYALVGHGPGGDRGHGALRFGTHEEALGHMEKHGLEHYTPKRTNLGDDPSRP